MKRVALETIGCRLNQYETERMAAGLEACGFRRVSFDEEAELYIINSCTVTGRADASSRRAIFKAGRHSGHPRIVVVGCYVTAEPERVAQLEGVDLVIDNIKKEKLIPILTEHFPELFDDGGGAPQVTEIKDFRDHNRAWVKVGDGCNQNCSFCIVPLVRGRMQNRPAPDIISEINSLVEYGYEEIVLTAVHTGQYREGAIGSLAQLAEMILDRTGVKRLRFSSIEPQEITAEFRGLMHDRADRICRHLHIPLQSGSDRILAMMNRPYKIGQYLSRLERLRQEIEGITIGADLIVGFPGETEEDFQMSVEAAESGLIDYLHVFSYSDRRGTTAATFSGKIGARVIKSRNETLRLISDSAYKKAMAREIGKTVQVISEHRAQGESYYWGITDNYLKVSIPAPLGGTKKIIPLHIISSTDDFLIGRQS